MQDVKCIIFDCDNTLVSSEDPAFGACAPLANELLASYGIPFAYTSEDLLIDFIGLNFKGIMLGLQKKHKFTMTQKEMAEYSKKEEDFVIEQLMVSAEPCPGSLPVIEKLAQDKEYKIAIASSSAIRRIRIAIERAGHAQFFDPSHVFSAQSSLETPASKPSPAVYLHAMEKLGVKDEECISVEDSRSGAASAVCAGVRCIAYVGAYNNETHRDQVARTLLEVGCKVVMEKWEDFFECLEKIKRMA